MCYAVENNESIIDVDTVNVTKESSFILMFTEVNSNNMDNNTYTLYIDDNDSFTAENNENYNNNGLITHTFLISPTNFTNNLRRLAIDNNLTHAALNMILELINPAYPFLLLEIYCILLKN